MTAAEETDHGFDRFKAHYDRLKKVNADEKWKVETAERFAANPALDCLIAPENHSTSVPFPFFPGDYPDTKQPSRVGGR